MSGCYNKPINKPRESGMERNREQEPPQRRGMMATSFPLYVSNDRVRLFEAFKERHGRNTSKKILNLIEADMKENPTSRD